MAMQYEMLIGVILVQMGEITVYYSIQCLVAQNTRLPVAHQSKGQAPHGEASSDMIYSDQAVSQCLYKNITRYSSVRVFASQILSHLFSSAIIHRLLLVFFVHVSVPCPAIPFELLRELLPQDLRVS